MSHLASCMKLSSSSDLARAGCSEMVLLNSGI